MASVNIYPSKHAYTDSGRPNTAMDGYTISYWDSNIEQTVYKNASDFIEIGSSNYGLISSYCAGNGEGWLTFSLTNIPSGAIINTVTLNFNLLFIRDYEFYGEELTYLNIYKCIDTTSWSQSTITYNNAPNSSVSGITSGSMNWLASSSFLSLGPHSITLTNSDISNSKPYDEVTYKIVTSSFFMGTLLGIAAGTFNSINLLPYLTIDYTNTLPTSNISTDIIINTLGLSTPTTFQQMCQAGNVNTNGLNNTYCPGANASARLTNLQTAPFDIGKFRGYDHNA